MVTRLYTSDMGCDEMKIAMITFHPKFWKYTASKMIQLIYHYVMMSKFRPRVRTMVNGNTRSEIINTRNLSYVFCLFSVVYDLFQIRDRSIRFQVNGVHISV